MNRYQVVPALFQGPLIWIGINHLLASDRLGFIELGFAALNLILIHLFVGHQKAP